MAEAMVHTREGEIKKLKEQIEKEKEVVVP